MRLRLHLRRQNLIWCLTKYSITWFVPFRHAWKTFVFVTEQTSSAHRGNFCDPPASEMDVIGYDYSESTSEELTDIVDLNSFCCNSDDFTCQRGSWSFFPRSLRNLMVPPTISQNNPAVTWPKASTFWLCSSITDGMDLLCLLQNHRQHRSLLLCCSSTDSIDLQTVRPF